jgi:hypothetical protein
MATRSLFEALAGYAPPAGGPGDGPAILGGPGARGDYLWSERDESQFLRILDTLEARARTDPEFAGKLADAFDVPPDPALLRARLAESREIVERARAGGLLGAGVRGGVADFPELLGVPADFSDRYVAEHVPARYWEGKPRIDLQPKLRRFEDDSPLGMLGWFVFNGPEALEVPRSLRPPFREQFGRIPGAQRFRRHGAGDGDYVHPLPAPGGGETTRVALFADFGTGLGHAAFVARQLTVDRFEAAIHLGDVYYTGTPEQYRSHFEVPLDPVLRSGTQLFVVPDNHDGYSGFHAYCDFLDRRLTQKGSYFALESEHVQLIAVDTIWHGDRGRIQDAGVRAWLEGRFAAGRAAGRTNVLLTGHEPYAYEKAETTDLHEDVRSLAHGALDLWFWGNTHYCALFDRSAATPYYGSCIGHAGYPYEREKRGAPANAAPVLFLESGSRYEGSDVRTDRGMNGFCALEIEPSGDIALRYLDWRGHERCRARFEREASGAVSLAGGVEDLTPGS